MAFQQGLSGLKAASASLDVIGNNIANSSTVGFKQSQAQFADIYAGQLIGGLSHNQAGIGVSVSTVAQSFTQGTIETSTNPLDMAINGGGFYRVQGTSGQVQYSRNGQFQLDKNGFIVNAQLAKLTGYTADSKGNILAGAPEAIQIDPSDMLPNATTKINSQVNLNSESKMPTTVPFSADDPDTYNAQIPTTVYDTLGNAHVMQTFYVKTGENTWDMYNSIDGLELKQAEVAAAVQTAGGDALAARAAYQAAVTAVPQNDEAVQAAAATYATAAGAAMAAAAGEAGATEAQQAAITTQAASGENASLTPDQIDVALAATIVVPATSTGKLIFTGNGVLNKLAMGALDPAQTVPFNITLPIFPSTGSVKPLVVGIDVSGSTQIAAVTSEKASTQDGYAGGQLNGFAADANGVLVGQYSNGKTRNLGQVVLASFRNPNGLQPLGNNVWAETSASGNPLVGVPGTGTLGPLVSSAVENSNVDLTVELVNMITAQRAYQANAQTIKTQDSVLQTLVNLR